MNKIEVCLTPALFDYHKNENAIAVVVDVLRATTSICSAFKNGVKTLIPVGTEEEAKEMKEKGYVVAAERNGVKLDFADFGNSPENFSAEAVGGKEVAYSTTNGTKTIMLANYCSDVVIGAFSNLAALSEWLIQQNKDVVVVCAGWKNRFNIEDSVFAGALTDYLLSSGEFETICDAAKSTKFMWENSKSDLLGFINTAAQKQRLKKNNLDYSIPFCVTLDTTTVIPILQNDRLVEVSSI